MSATCRVTTAQIIRMNFIILIQLCFVMMTIAYPETINVKIRNGNEIIELKWQHTRQYLANENLPVWYAQENALSHIKPQEQSKLRQFICYQDVEKSSAVVFYPSIQRFYGIIDTRFYVTRMPLSHDPNIVYDVDGNYIISMHGNEYSHNHKDDWLLKLFSEDQLSYINTLIAQNIGKTVPEPSLKRSYPEPIEHNLPSTSAGHGSITEGESTDQNLNTPQPKILYPEILVFVTSDIFDIFRRPNFENGINLLLLYYVTYFNAVDMLFAKLAMNDIKIHINIAGIVIESHPHIFLNDLRGRSETNVAQSAFHAHGDRILHDISRYINEHKNMFAEDSFDMFFVSTGWRIDSDTTGVQGKSTSMLSVYAQRVWPQCNKNYLGSVVHRKTSLQDYIVATREIASLLQIQYDVTDGGQFENNKRCHSIMQNTYTHCQNYLQWTKQNRRELQSFIRLNLNHCYLVNFPRSLSPYGRPVPSINPEDQCLCYNYPMESLNPFYIMSIPADSCDKRMKCSHREHSEKLLPFPIDGTPCGSSSKVCWRKKCIEVDQPRNGDDSYEGYHRKAKKMRTTVHEE